jgi:hypothetical protein
MLLPRAAGQGAVGPAPGRGCNGPTSRIHLRVRVPRQSSTNQTRTDLTDLATASAARLPIAGSVTGRLGAARVEDKAPALWCL